MFIFKIALLCPAKPPPLGRLTLLICQNIVDVLFEVLMLGTFFDNPNTNRKKTTVLSFIMGTTVLFPR